MSSSQLIDLPTFIAKYAPMDPYEAITTTITIAYGFNKMDWKIETFLDFSPCHLFADTEGNFYQFSTTTITEKFGEDSQEAENVRNLDLWPVPEYFLETRVSDASAVFILGLIAFELISGDTPFLNQGLHEDKTIIRLSDILKDVNAELDDALYQALSLDPSERYSHPSNFVSKLEEIKQDLAN